jgi:hypothetical protein
MKTTMIGLQYELQLMENPFDFTRGGLGQAIIDAGIIGIIDNTWDELEPDGTPWAPLSQGYAAWKNSVRPGQRIGRLWDVMLAIPEIMGVQTILPARMVHQFGVTDQAKLEALKFQEGGLVTGTNQPPRPFFGITIAACYMDDTLLENRFYSFIV